MEVPAGCKGKVPAGCKGKCAEGSAGRCKEPAQVWAGSRALRGHWLEPKPISASRGGATGERPSRGPRWTRRTGVLVRLGQLPMQRIRGLMGPERPSRLLDLLILPPTVTVR